MTYIIDFKASQCSTQCIGQSRKESRKTLTCWLQKYRLPARFCLAFLVRYKTFQATHNVGLSPPETLQDPQRRTIPPETLHFRRKAIPPKKLQRKTIPPGTPQERLF